MYSSNLSYSIPDDGTKSIPREQRSQGMYLVQHTPQGLQPVPSRMENASQGVFTSFPIGNQEVITPLKTERVLQVEDNSENRFIVHRYLRNDYRYDSVNQGEQALTLLEEKTFDIIIMDVNLGAGINGIETARQIRQQRKFDNIAIIAVTANVSPEIKGECKKAGMDAFLPKPFRKHELKEVIENVLRDKN